jgi:hypothetical protein
MLSAITMLLWMALVVALIFWVVQSARRGGNQLFQPESAIEILKKREGRDLKRRI